MSIILNLGLSASFQTIDWQTLDFPGVMCVALFVAERGEADDNVQAH